VGVVVVAGGDVAVLDVAEHNLSKSASSNSYRQAMPSSISWPDKRLTSLSYSTNFHGHK
jgi:hypothetical protein